jgi:hypothetical protein
MNEWLDTCPFEHSIDGIFERITEIDVNHAARLSLGHDIAVTVNALFRAIQAAAFADGLSAIRSSYAARAPVAERPEGRLNASHNSRVRAHEEPVEVELREELLETRDRRAECPSTKRPAIRSSSARDGGLLRVLDEAVQNERLELALEVARPARGRDDRP